jgi:predicted metal-dependent enzyme (double-stranded beta helix superfamily)
MSARGTERGSNENLAGIDGPVRLLLERIAGPAAAEAPDLKAIGAAIADLAADLDYMMLWVRRLGDEAGSLPIHAPTRGPRLSLVHRPEGQMSALHDHGTWVAISPIIGREMHRRYRVDSKDPTALPQLVEVRALEAADVVTLLPPDDVHDHGHVAGQGPPAHVLILTGDDQTRFARHEWDPATGRHRVLNPGEAGRRLASEPMPDA